MLGSSFLPEGGVDSVLPAQVARYLQVAKRVDVVGQHGHGQRLQQVEERRADGRCARDAGSGVPGLCHISRS